MKLNFNDEKVIAGFASLLTAIVYLFLGNIPATHIVFNGGAFSALLFLCGGCFTGSIIDDKINPSGGANA